MEVKKKISQISKMEVKNYWIVIYDLCKVWSATSSVAWIIFQTKFLDAENTCYHDF